MGKRAYKYIDDNVTMIEAGYRMVDARSAYVAVDIAEMDIVERAAEAFCRIKCPEGCPYGNYGSTGCGHVMKFIKTLNKH